MPAEQAPRAPSRVARFMEVLRQVAGMPDYARYLAHMAARHPECRVLSEKEYCAEYLNGRYGAGASRCC